jgi:hypothetical protein
MSIRRLTLAGIALLAVAVLAGPTDFPGMRRAMMSLWGMIDSVGAAVTFGASAGSTLTWLIVAFAPVLIRGREYQNNRRIEAPDDQQMRWHITHVRDDIGSLVLLLAMTNTLLCAILGVLLFTSTR